MLRIVLIALLIAFAGCANTARIVQSPVLVKRAVPKSGAERQLVITIRERQGGLRATPGSSARAYAEPPAYQASAYTRRVIASLEHDYPIEWIDGWHIEVLGVHCAVFEVRDRTARDALLTRLRNDARVESAQPMNTFTTSARSAAYNDPYFSLQKGVEAMRVPEAHRWARGRGVTVAIIDTGADTEHPELSGRILLSRNFVDDDTERFRMDRHGTAVAGVIAALTNNREGIVGVAPAAELMVLKACWEERPDAPAVCNTLTLAEALAFAIQRRARIINLSLTGPSDPLLSRLVDRALSQGTLVLGAAANAFPGRSLASTKLDGFPLGIPGVIAVADASVTPAIARNQSTGVMPAAQRGETDAVLQRTASAGHEMQALSEARSSATPPHAAVAGPALLAAPGSEVLTLAPGGRYDYVSGASISVAMVSGVVALLLEHGQGLTSAGVRAVLEHTSIPDEDSGTRIVDACDAVASIVQTADCGNPGPRTAADSSHR
ncbi:MAG: S8 family serine peptidase [Steroidobacteraceae bacterium]|nr:S8 family serine peptidase [Steroidobacteraceae bacterium]